MYSDEIVRRIRSHRARLDELGVASLALFGSAARNEARENSDIDLLVRFEGTATFDRYMDLKLFLEDLLGYPVDLVTDRALRDELRPHIEKDLLLVA